MAQILTQDDLGKDNTNQPGQGLNAPGTQQNAPGQPSVTQGSTGGAQPAGGPPAPSGGRKATGGSGFTNIQRIMGANVGNRLGQTVAGGIQNIGQQTQQQLGQANQQFQQGAQAGRLDTQTNQQLIQQGLQDPSQLTPGQVSQFQNILSGKYQGPQGLQNADQLQGQAQYAQQLGQQLGSQGGKQNLLQRFVGGNQYGGGQQTLDALLMGAGPQQQLAQARRETGGLGAKTASDIAAAQAQAQQLGARAQQVGQQAGQQFGQVVGQQVQGLQQQAQTEQAARDKQYQDLISGLQSGTISAEDAGRLGLTSGQRLFNVFQGPGAQGLVQENPMKASAQNVASAQDYARMQALQKLAGSYAPAQVAQQLGQFSGQQGQAGAFQAGGTYQADPNQIQQAIKQQSDAYQQQLANLKAQQAQLGAQQGILGGLGFGHTAATINPQMAAIQAQLAALPGQSGYENLLKIAGQP